MFKITAFEYKAGKIRMSIETDYGSSAAFLRLFAAADKFAEAYQYRIRAQIHATIDGRDPDRLRLAEEARQQHARYLKAYRAFPGPRRDRLAALRAFAAGEGKNLGYDSTINLLKMARQEEKEETRKTIKQLRLAGHSLREIGRKTGKPLSSLSRLVNHQHEPPLSFPARNRIEE